jgi:hypothetical protein
MKEQTAGAGGVCGQEEGEEENEERRPRNRGRCHNLAWEGILSVEVGRIFVFRGSISSNWSMSSSVKIALEGHMAFHLEVAPHRTSLCVRG